MAATVIIVRLTGASGTISETDVTNGSARHKTADNATVDTVNPIPIPASGTNYSYWVSCQLKATTTPTGTINNLRWYSNDGTNNFGTGVSMKVADASTGADGGYRQATGTSGTTGTELTTGNHSGIDGTPADAFTKTSASPLTLSGSITNPSTGRFGDVVVTQMAVTSSATAGTSPSETFVFKYDET